MDIATIAAAEFTSSPFYYPFSSLKALSQTRLSDKLRPAGGQKISLYKGYSAYLVGMGIYPISLYREIKLSDKYPGLKNGYIETLMNSANLSVILTPFDRVQIMSQTSNVSTTQIFKNLMMQQNRISSFYRGFNISFVNNVMFMGICKSMHSYMEKKSDKSDNLIKVTITKKKQTEFACYSESDQKVEQSEELVEEDISKEANKVIRSFGNFILSGILSTAIVHPIDTIRTCVMSDVVQINGKPGSSIEVAKSIYNSYGPKGFYRGLTPSLVSTGVGSTLIITVGVFYTSVILARG